MGTSDVGEWANKLDVELIKLAPNAEAIIGPFEIKGFHGRNLCGGWWLIIRV
jgi:hypothetical protein